MDAVDLTCECKCPDRIRRAPCRYNNNLVEASPVGELRLGFYKGFHLHRVSVELGTHCKCLLSQPLVCPQRASSEQMAIRMLKVHIAMATDVPLSLPSILTETEIRVSKIRHRRHHFEFSIPQPPLDHSPGLSSPTSPYHG